jgi:predicted nucleic acid-binding protein
VNWLLDTNVLSELRKGERANPGVRAWYARTPAAELYTSVLVLGEIRRGIESVRRRDAMAATALEHWLGRMAEGFADRILPIDAAVADRWGALNVPDPVPTVDGLLAATALFHDLVLVTRNVRDVSGTGVRVFDPTA